MEKHTHHYRIFPLSDFTYLLSTYFYYKTLIKEEITDFSGHSWEAETHCKHSTDVSPC